MVHPSGTALLTIVNDVLDYSRAEAGSLSIERIPFSLSQVVQEVVDLQHTVAMAKSLQLHLSLADSLPEEKFEPTPIVQQDDKGLFDRVKDIFG